MEQRTARGWSGVARRAVVALGVVFAVAGPVAAQTPAPIAIEIEVPATDEWPAAVMSGEAFLPEGAGPFPVVIYSHGRASRPADRARLARAIPSGHAGHWLRRGFAVVAAIRPGYGARGGADRERSGTRIEVDGSCGGKPRITAASAASAAAVTATIDWTRRQTWAAKDRILLVGTSAGGLATVVAASRAPPGVVGLVDFSGGSAGYPKERPGASCGEAALTAVFRRAGRGVRVPSLWLYAENDRYWGAAAPRRWHAAFAAGGSATTLVVTEPLAGDDGHRLMLRGGRLWSQPVDRFVTGLGFEFPVQKTVSSPEPE